MDMYKSARELAKSLDEFLASVKEEVLLECCENISDARQVANLCAALSKSSEDAYDDMEREGFNSERIGLQQFVLLQMIVVGGATIQKWLAEKAAEYEELRDAG